MAPGPLRSTEGYLGDVRPNLSLSRLLAVKPAALGWQSREAKTHPARASADHTISAHRTASSEIVHMVKPPAL